MHSQSRATDFCTSLQKRVATQTPLFDKGTRRPYRYEIKYHSKLEEEVTKPDKPHKYEMLVGTEWRLNEKK